MTRDRKRIWDFWWALLPALLAIAIFAALLAAPAPAGADRTSASKKLQREIDIMERTIDDVLVDSPYILVSSTSGVTKGVHVPEFGIIFTFDMSLVSSRHDGFHWFGAIVVDVDDDGDRIIIHRRPRWRGDDDEVEHETDKTDKKDKKSWWERREADAKKCYERGKNEIDDALINYGDMLTGLSEDQWVLIAADLGGSEHFADNDLSQYVVKGRMGDIRAYGKGTLTRDALLARVTREER